MLTSRIPALILSDFNLPLSRSLVWELGIWFSDIHITNHASYFFSFPCFCTRRTVRIFGVGLRGKLRTAFLHGLQVLVPLVASAWFVFAEMSLLHAIFHVTINLELVLSSSIL